MKRLRIARYILKYSVLLVLLVVFFSHAVVRQSAQGVIVDDPEVLPGGIPVMVLGTSRFTRSGRTNAFFENRMNAAAQLYHTGRFPILILSGGRTGPSYDEPEMMYLALLERDIPSEWIIRDGAGFRTLDSVVRMRDVFGQDTFIIVSQRFHLERAVFIAKASGLDVWGFAAGDASGTLNLHIRLREYLARVQAILDVYLFRTTPKAPVIPVPIEFPR